MPNTHRRRRRDSTVELSRVGGVNAFVGSRVVTQFTISCAVELLRLVTNDDIMTSFMKTISNIDQNSRSQIACLVSKLSTESVGSRREL